MSTENLALKRFTDEDAAAADEPFSVLADAAVEPREQFVTDRVPEAQ